MTLEQSAELPNLESLGFLEVGKKSFMVSADLCVITKLAFDEFLKVFVEFVN